MNETLLVRAAGGAWEELQPRTELPEGGVSELLGEDVRSVLGADLPVLVAACAPVLPAGAPDAICVDTSGGVWVLQTALDGPGDQLLGQLLGFAGGLTGASAATFADYCDRRGGSSLVDWVASHADDGFDPEAFQSGLEASLAAGRIRLVALVQHASPTLVQSFRYLTSAGALGSIFELASFGSSTVSAIRATQVDLLGASAQPAAAAPATPVASAPAAAPAPAAPAAPQAPVGGNAPRRSAANARASAPTEPAAADGVAFVEAAAQVSGDSTAALLGQLQAACAAAFDDMTYEHGDAQAAMHAGVTTPDGVATMMTARADGSIMLAFEDIGVLDPTWTVRAELCQGMERLLGTDLGDVRQISQLNLSVEEHLMDATLMDALTDLLADTVQSLHGQGAVAA